MIVVIDDDRMTLVFIQRSLEKDESEVRTFECAETALEFLSSIDPELIIADILMPGMDGFEFKDLYTKQFPNRATPFIFLSSLDDEKAIIKGLKKGADDYLIKPVSGPLLRTKIRTIINRKKNSSMPIYNGNLKYFPFDQLINFFEIQSLSGEVKIQTFEETYLVGFKNGEMFLEEMEIMDKVLNLDQGDFLIRIFHPDFSEFYKKAPDGDELSAIPSELAGMISIITVDGRDFQIKTDFQPPPFPKIVTNVNLDQKLVFNKLRDVPEEGDDKLKKLINHQHKKVEDEIRSNFQSLLQNQQTELKSIENEYEVLKNQYDQLLKNGLKMYQESDFAAALSTIAEAYKKNRQSKFVKSFLKLIVDHL